MFFREHKNTLHFAMKTLKRFFKWYIKTCGENYAFACPSGMIPLNLYKR